MKKKHRRLLIALICVITVLAFVPFPSGSMEDGGTTVYRAPTYEIVVWNRMVGYARLPDGSITLDVSSGDEGFALGFYHRVAIYWFSDAELYGGIKFEREMAREDFFEHFKTAS